MLDIPHEIVITGRVPKLDMAAAYRRPCHAYAKRRSECLSRASHTTPFDRYTFLTMALGDGYGGLEHRSSTALVTKREGLPFVGMTDTTEAYRNFLGLASHEYFHSWNVKRIKPAAFVPYDLSRENHTRLLWAFEGFTSYYDDLLLTRAGLLSEAQYLTGLAKTLTTVTQRSSRLKQSVADSSFDAWIKYYRQDENAPNSVVSYYQKGSLIGLAIDLSIRARTKGKRSLDDVMRLLWKQWKTAGADYAVWQKIRLLSAVEQATGLSLARELAEWTEGTRDPDYEALFAPFGVSCARRPDVDAAHFALLGIKTANTNLECKVAHVFDGTPAQAAGLSANDVLVALDGLRATPVNLDTLLSRYATGDVIEILAFRRDELMRFEVKLATQPPLKFVLEIDPKSARDCAADCAAAGCSRARSSRLGAS